MPNLSVRPYTPVDAPVWNAFTAGSKNATFLLDRRYMDYHSDRFTDASLIIERKGQSKPCMLFAASRQGETVTAHGGLTYGGLIMPFTGADGADVVHAMELIADHYRATGASTLIYKAIPYIYHRNPSDEDLYALFRLGAAAEGCGLSSAIDLHNPCRFNENMRRNVRKARTAYLSFSTGGTESLAEFHSILSRVLSERHNTRPVHTLAELQLLAGRFPQNIILAAAHNPAGRMVAGTLLYLTDKVAHAQYIAATDEGRATGALPALFSYVIENLCAGRTYLDFGISTEQGGAILNEGLLHQKYSMGGRGVAYNIFRLSL